MEWYRAIDTFELWIIAAFVVVYILYLGRVVMAAKKFNRPFGLVFVKIFLRAAWILLMVMAILGPAVGDVKKEIKSTGKDIYIAVDLSESMNAIDVIPSRLERVKAELRKIVQAFNSDRIGLIIFSGDAFVQCPLTEDISILNLFISTLNTSLVSGTGTDFSAPLEMALEKLQSGESVVSQQTSKLVVFISDGEDFGDGTQGVLRKYEEAGIRIYSLGVGSEKGSRIPTRSGFKRDQSNQEVVTRLVPDDLQEMARETGGRYFELEENDTERLINAIRDVEGELRDTREMDVAANQYLWFLWAALALLLLDLALNLRVIKL